MVVALLLLLLAGRRQHRRAAKQHGEGSCSPKRWVGMTGFEPPSRAKASLLMPSGRFNFSGFALTSGLRSSPPVPLGTPKMSLTSVGKK